MQTHSLATQQSQSIYPTAVGKESAAFTYYWTLSKENGQLVLKSPELPDEFQARVFKGNIRCEASLMAQLVKNPPALQETLV